MASPYAIGYACNVIYDGAKIVYGEPSNLLSCRDIVKVLGKVLPHKDRTVEDVISIIAERHKKRKLAMIYHYKSSSPQGP